MKPVLVVLLALVVAVIAGHYVAEDPGFVVIGYGGKVVRTTAAFFALVTLAAMLAIYMLIRLASNVGSLRGRWRRWSQERRQRRSQDALANGLVALASSEFTQAERAFYRGVDGADRPEAHYFAAALAAHAARTPARRDNYLALAGDAAPQLRDALTLRRAEWLLESGQLSQAQPLVERLEGRMVSNPALLRLRYELALKSGDHALVFGLLPGLRRDRVLPHDEANALERSAAAALLAQGGVNDDDLKQRWRGLPRHLHADADVLTVYARALCQRGQHELAEELVRKRLERRWDSALAALYGEILCEPPNRQLRKLEAWAVTHGEDPGLRLARARQAIRGQLWGQAQEQLKALMALAPSPLLHELLAAIADGRGDAEAAEEHRRLGLTLATHAEVMPALPGSRAD